MQAEIAVGVEFAIVPEHPDLVVAEKDYAAVAVLELGKFRDEFLGHNDTPWRPTLGFILFGPFGVRLLVVLAFGRALGHGRPKSDDATFLS
jgi:hypothetical protein